MRFLKSALLALVLASGLFTTDAKKQHHHHNPLFSQTAPTEMMLQDMFSAYMKQYSKKYSHDEFASRFETFKRNVDIIRTHNTQVKSTWTMGLNEFADLTHEEFKARNGYKAIKNDFLRSKNAHQVRKNIELPTSVDWRNSNAVTPVKNQGQCGSCWAFSTTGSTEGAWALKHGQLISLSEEQLVDCSAKEGNQGCNGGLMDQGFQYIIDAKGLCTEAAYPYAGTQGTCNAAGCKHVVTVSGFKDVTALDETALLDAVAQQPVSVAIEADQLGFQFYSSGVFSGTCGTTLDHGVLIVGYGTDSSTGTAQNYWIVKNSWGASWGESGYIRLIRGQNQCGINQQASYPIV